MRKSLLTLAVVSAFAVPTVASAQSTPAASPHTLTGNVGLFSEYIFRGIKQTDGKPALQGGFDYSHASGIYLGTWASNVSVLADAGAYNGSSLEMDFYGGYKGSLGDFGYDVGLLKYYYPGRVNPGFVKADALEIYGAATWKWLTAKLSLSLDDETFGVPNSKNTYYLDLSANFPVTDKLALQAHYGIQEFKGTTAGVSNDSFASYKDWKLGVTYALPQSFTVGAFFTDTDMNGTQTAFYTNPAGRFLGKETFGLFVQKTF
ncbi:MAG TPA: TorF family putative porin [Burkholderiales bacterium]|nr:TorF family putative porin [Burkholderiales bacterium]